MSETLPPVALERLGGCVLAGGRSTRMGGEDKGLIQFDGEALVSRILRQLAPQVRTVIINANRNLERYRAFGVPVAVDTLDGFRGPLAGMHAALGALRQSCDAVLFVPCDAPDLAPDLAARLLAALGGRRAALAHAAGRLQPAFSILRVAEHTSLERALSAGEQRMAQYFESIDAALVDFDDRAASFKNLNGPEDIRAHFRQAAPDES